MSRPRIHFGPCSRCEKPAKVKGLCLNHYQQFRKRNPVGRLQDVRLRNTLLLIQDRLESGDYDEQELISLVKACRMSLSPQA